jgi:hypothetical protein
MLLLATGARPAYAQKQDCGKDIANSKEKNTENGKATRYHIRGPKKDGAASSSSDELKRVKAATMRSWRNGFVLGTLFSTEPIDIEFKSGVYGWGYAGGDVQRCVWVLLMDVERVDSERGKREPRCGAPRRIEVNEFSTETNSVTCPNCHQSMGGGSGTKLQGSALFYPNYHGKPLGDSVRLDDKHIVLWRYVTKDGRYVLVMLPGGRWGFVPKGNVPKRPVYTKCPKVDPKKP